MERILDLSSMLHTKVDFRGAVDIRLIKRSFIEEEICLLMVESLQHLETGKLEPGTEIFKDSSV